MIDLASQSARQDIIAETKSQENKDRKSQSMVQFDVYQDRLDKYVQAYLRSQFSNTTVNAMPVVSSVNLARRIINQEASIYKCEPYRTFEGVDDIQKEVLEQIYSDGQFNVKFNKSNIYYKLQNQNLLQVVLKNGKLTLRCLLGHHYDVIPKQDDPEIADAYIMSAFDKSLFLNSTTLDNPVGLSLPNQPNPNSNGVNESIGDQDDYLSVLEKYVVWSDQYNFIMDKDGKVISGPDVVNPLGVLPFVDVAADKDFEYYVRQGQTIVDFTIQYNGALSDLGNVVRLQGWAQAYIKGPADLMPENLQVGPNHILKLVIDPNNQTPTEFGFASPTADLAGSIAYAEMLLANFLSSRGVDPKTISGKAQTTAYSSGLERLLAMIDRFEASRNDLALFRNVESKVFDIVKAYLNTFSGTEFLDQKYWVKPISEDATIVVNFEKPESIQTETEVLDIIQKKNDLGIMSRVDALMELEGISREQALDALKQIDEDNNGEIAGDQTQSVRSEPNS